MHTHTHGHAHAQTQTHSTPEAPDAQVRGGILARSSLHAHYWITTTITTLQLRLMDYYYDYYITTTITGLLLRVLDSYYDY